MALEQKLQQPRLEGAPARGKSRPIAPREFGLRGIPGWLPELVSLDSVEVARRCVAKLPGEFGYAAGAVYLPDFGFTRLRCGASSIPGQGLADIPIDQQQTDPRAWAALRQRRLCVEDAAETCRARGWRLPSYLETGQPLRWLLQAVSCDGVLTALLEFVGPGEAGDLEAGGTAQRGRLHATTLMELLGRLFANAAAFQAARLEARQDALTGLFNRRAFREELEREIGTAARNGSPLALLMLDLDGLKQINDRHGHQSGDAVLAAMAQTLRAALRSRDIPARIGGDEFAAILPQTEQAAAAALLEKLRSDFASARPGRDLSSSVSVGVAQWQPGWQREQLLAAADESLYAWKSGRR